MKKNRYFTIIAYFISTQSLLGGHGIAQNIPSNADVNRINPQQQSLPNKKLNPTLELPVVVPELSIPQDAQMVKFILNQVQVLGVSAYKPEQLQDIYAQYVGKEITLAQAYHIAGAITERYRNDGYFLSAAHVPNQKIKDGKIIIQVVEGYVGSVKIKGRAKNSRLLKEYIEDLLAKKPLKSSELESFLLRINGLAGASFDGILTSSNDRYGAVELNLVQSAKGGQGIISFDNSNSRFLGPNGLNVSYSTSLLD